MVSLHSFSENLLQKELGHFLLKIPINYTELLFGVGGARPFSD